MSHNTPAEVAKVHPATREILPDDPLEMQSFELPGDPHLMLTLLVEDYARMGWGVDAITALARDPNYQAFHGLWKFLGDEQFSNRVRQILARCGVMRVQTQETETIPAHLVQLDLPK